LIYEHVKSTGTELKISDTHPQIGILRPGKT
jgi:hypothetical protein